MIEVWTDDFYTGRTSWFWSFGGETGTESSKLAAWRAARRVVRRLAPWCVECRHVIRRWRRWLLLPDIGRVHRTCADDAIERAEVQQ